MNTLLDYKTQGESYSLSEMIVKQIPQRVGRKFVKEHHYTGGCGTAAMTWGLYSQETLELLGVAAVQTPISENVRASIFGPEMKDAVTELHRLVTVDRVPHNTGSWFMSRLLDALKDYKPKYKALVAFADTTEGHDGTQYQASNADYYGTSDTVTYYRTPDGQLKAPRQVGENISKDEARARGWELEQREQKHRYVWWLPDPYELKDDLREQAEIEIHPYPA